MLIKVSDALDRLDEFRVHPLGFWYLKIKISDLFMVRMHVWTEKNRSNSFVENDIHQHSFHLVSRVLLGNIDNRLFNFVPNQAGSEVEYKIQYSGLRTTINPTGRVGYLSKIAQFSSPAGTSYELDAGIPHEITITKHPCVTSVLMEEKSAKTLCYGNDDSEPAGFRRSLTPSETAKLVEVLSNCIDAGEPSIGNHDLGPI